MLMSFESSHPRNRGGSTPNSDHRPASPHRATLCTVFFGSRLGSTALKSLPGLLALPWARTGEQASPGLFPSKVASRAQGSGLRNSSAFPASSFLMTPACYISLVAFSNQ